MSHNRMAFAFECQTLKCLDFGCFQHSGVRNLNRYCILFFLSTKTMTVQYAINLPSRDDSWQKLNGSEDYPVPVRATAASEVESLVQPPRLIGPMPSCRRPGLKGRPTTCKSTKLLRYSYKEVRWLRWQSGGFVTHRSRVRIWPFMVPFEITF